MLSPIYNPRVHAFKAAIYLVCLAGTLGPQVLAAQGTRVPYRDLPRNLVPTPNQLLEKLSGLQGINLPKSSTQKLMDLGEKMLSGMNDQQKEYFRGLAEEIQGGKNPPLPPELRELAKKQQISMLPEDASINLKDILRELPDASGQKSSSSPQRNSATTEFPGTGNYPNPQSRKNRNTGSDRESRTNSTVPPIFDADPVFDAGAAEQIVNRLEETISQMPEEGVFKPESDWFQSTEDENKGSSTGITESVGNRFDRMIMEAVQSQMSEVGEPNSPLADSVGGLLGGLIDQVHGRLNEREWGSQQDRSQGSGISSAGSSPRRWSVPGGSWGVWNLGNGDGGNQFLAWLGVIFLAIACLALAVWWIARTTTLKQSILGGFSPRSLTRKSKIQNSPDFVRAVDRFLLLRYGKPSSWWHVGRAQIALNAESPALQPRIHHLVQCYEYARYSEVGQTLSEQDISKCTEILSELANGPGPGISSEDTDASL